MKKFLILFSILIFIGCAISNNKNSRNTQINNLPNLTKIRDINQNLAKFKIDEGNLIFEYLATDKIEILPNLEALGKVEAVKNLDNNQSLSFKNELENLKDNSKIEFINVDDKSLSVANFISNNGNICKDFKKNEKISSISAINLATDKKGEFYTVYTKSYITKDAGIEIFELNFSYDINNKEKMNEISKCANFEKIGDIINPQISAQNTFISRLCN
ncbi:hypothetical protein [Campylobacter hominis]